MRLTCGVLGFSPQAFYKWRSRPCSDRDWADAHTTNAIVDVHADDPEFGYRFIADELEAAGSSSRASGGCGGCAAQQRVWSTTTKKGRKHSGKTPGPAVHDDLVQRVLHRAGARHGVADRHHRAPDRGGQALLLLDQGRVLEPDRRLRARRPHDRAARRSARCARAIARRQPDGTVVVHSDRGGQFRSRAFRADAQGERADRVDGPRRGCRRQRGDGVVLLAAAEERAQPSASLAAPAASSPTRSSSGSSTPTTAAAANAPSASSPPSSSNSPSPHHPASTTTTAA